MSLILGDCLEEMFNIPDKSVDMVCCDLPYGTTACKWDTVLSLDILWHHYKRICKDNAAIVLFGSQPFTTTLIASNMKMFKYCWVWEKEQGTNQFLSKIQPMKKHEDITVFGQKKIRYNPQFTEGKRIKSIRDKNGGFDYITNTHLKPTKYDNKGKRYPTTIIRFKRDLQGRLHPTQKPAALVEYLIKTYTNEGDAILDNCMGSGTTIVAADNLNRNSIGIEKDKKYFDIAVERINKNRERLKNEQ